MRKILKTVWVWITRAEEAHSLYTWVLPLIPATIGGMLAAYVAKQGYFVWALAIFVYMCFSVGRYFTAKYVSEFGLRGQILVQCMGLGAPSEINEELKTCKKRLRYSLFNSSSFPIFVRLKSRFTLDGRVFEDNDFDACAVIPPRTTRYVYSGPIENVSIKAENYTGAVEMLYGKSEKSLDMKFSLQVADHGGQGYNVISSKHETS